MRPSIRVIITDWLTFGRVYSAFKAAAAAQKELTPCVQGGAILAAASVICQEAPDEEADAACKALGRALAGS